MIYTAATRARTRNRRPAPPAISPAPPPPAVHGGFSNSSRRCPSPPSSPPSLAAVSPGLLPIYRLSRRQSDRPSNETPGKVTTKHVMLSPPMPVVFFGSSEMQASMQASATYEARQAKFENG